MKRILQLFIFEIVVISKWPQLFWLDSVITRRLLLFDISWVCLQLQILSWLTRNYNIGFHKIIEIDVVLQKFLLGDRQFLVVMPLILQRCIELIIFVRLELFQVLLFVVCNILDKAMPRLIFLLFLVKVISLVFSTCCISHLIVTESVAFFLPQFLHLLLVSLLLNMINNLEFSILTDYKRFRC